MDPWLIFHNSYVPKHVTYTWVVMVILILFGFAVTRKMDLYPRKWQNVGEVVIDSIDRLVVSVMGPEGRRMFPLIATLALFILLSNLAGLLPGFSTPTADLNTTLALALVVFVSTHIIGIRVHGIKYIKQFMGPIWWLSPLMLPIEIISHLARPLSMSMRLFGNMRGGHIVMGVFVLLLPLFAPLPVMLLKLVLGVVQTAVFVLLSMIYFAGAMEEAH